MLNRSWSSLERELYELHQGEIQEVRDGSFLHRINFIEDGDLTELGRIYCESKFVFEDGEHKEILRTQLLDLREIRELCQSFYGQETQRENLERYLVARLDIEDRQEAGRIVILLNFAEILDYSTKSGKISFIIENLSDIEQESQDSYRISPRTPYSNVKRLRRVLRSCQEYILWLDKHFSKKGFEPLSDEIDGSSVSEIKILSGYGNTNNSLKNDYKRFKEEMADRGVDVELRVIASSDDYHAIHDRWIISANKQWNIPPVDTIFQNQESEIIASSESAPFDEFFEDAYELLDRWDEIQELRD